jgi:NAD(P)-dependent dehydrogenase (short-subunit alcohol dehydrogenase family)
MAKSRLGRVAIVTGAGRGLGRSMALGLLAAGAQVVAVDVDAPVLDALRGAAGGDGTPDRLLSMVADITREDETKDIVGRTVSQFGHLDILVNNAGLNLETVGPAGAKRPEKFWELSPAEFRRIFEVNAIAPFLLVRAAVEPMMARKWGRVVGVTTSLDTMWRKGMIPYGGSKAAHEAHSAAMAEELAGTGVTVNVLVPGGPVNTRMTASFGAAQAKLIQPDVMVAPLLWLTSADADKVTGRRFLAALWDSNLSGTQNAEKCGAPAAWPQLGRQTIFPAGHPS